MITKEQVEEARTELKQQYLQYYKDNFGIDIGTVVICRDELVLYGRECIVSRIETDLSYLPSSPRFFAKPRNKDGQWSKVELSFFSQETWELKR